MTIGLTGAHRTGKTTLAKAFAEKHKIPFVRTDASSVFVKLGLDPKRDYPLDVRLTIQENILTEFRNQWAAQSGREFITDRTPVDLMAYTLADIQRETDTREFDQRIAKYLSDCRDVVNRYFALLMVIQPGIELKEEAGKAPANPSYIEHIAQLVMGLTVGEGLSITHFYVPRRMTKIEDRIEAIEFALGRTRQKQMAIIENAKANGVPVSFH